MKNQKAKWTPKQIECLKNYAQKNKAHIASKFYQNIIKGRMQFRKAKGFFIRLGQQLGKSPAKCKSKFQKIEREIYLEVLKIPASHYKIYSYIRKHCKLTSDRFVQSGRCQVCFCPVKDSFTSSVQDAGKGPEEKSKTQLANGLHARFENLRIEIILKCKAGLLGSKNFSLLDLGILK